MAPFFFFLSLFFCIFGAVASPPVIECHTLYGGEEEIQTYGPTKNAYNEPLVKRSGFFNVRAVYEAKTHIGNIFKFYTYARLQDIPSLIHQGTYVVPAQKKASKYGFTGLQFVYEPTTEAELQYWCDLKENKK